VLAIKDGLNATHSFPVALLDREVGQVAVRQTGFDDHNRSGPAANREYDDIDGVRDIGGCEGSA